VSGKLRLLRRLRSSRLELQVDSVSHHPQTPYLITHDIVLVDGHAGQQDPAALANLHTAES